MCFACRHNEIFGSVLLKHQPHGFDIVAGKAPVAFRVKIPEIKLFLQTVKIRPTARVILRVTKVSPRRGDSWLNRIPLQAYCP